MKKIIMFFGVLFLFGCNMGTTHIIRDNNFQQIEIKENIKRSEGCDVVIPLLLMSGPIGKEESSIIKIAQNKNITKITYVEKKISYILPFFYNDCYVVYGY